MILYAIVWVDFPSPTHHESHCVHQQRAKYATVTMNNSFPTKEQAILIHAIDNTIMKDYVHAVAKVTGSEAIRFRFPNL